MDGFCRHRGLESLVFAFRIRRCASRVLFACHFVPTAAAAGLRQPKICTQAMFCSHQLWRIGACSCPQRTRFVARLVIVRTAPFVVGINFVRYVQTSTMLAHTCLADFFFLKHFCCTSSPIFVRYDLCDCP